LPITWEYKDYMPGHNEVVWVDNKLNQPLEISKAFNFLRSDDPRTKKDGENYIPSSKLYFEAPNGQPIFVKEARRYTRSEMMVLEMLSQNHFQRPMYFAVTVGNDYYLGLEPYFELTGLAYRITPERSRNGQPRVNTELMYDNMMHKFRYGGMNTPGIYIDENLMRMCRTHRMMFMQLAEALLQEGQQDKCREVLDYGEEMFPSYNIPYDYTSASMASLYYALGTEEDIAKANAMMSKVAETCREYLVWGDALNKEQRRGAQSTLRHQIGVLGFVLQCMDRADQKELFNQYYPIYQQYTAN